MVVRVCRGDNSFQLFSEASEIAVFMAKALGEIIRSLFQGTVETGTVIPKDFSRCTVFGNAVKVL